jgi:AcrR family transcriptional regulator
VPPKPAPAKRKAPAKKPAKRAVAPRGRGRPAGGSDALVTSILRATLRQLAHGGFAALSVESVAREAKVNKTTVYRRWPTKDDLVVAAVVAARQTAPPFAETGDLRHDLLTLLGMKARAFSDPKHRSVSLALMTLGPEVNSTLAAELRRQRLAVPLDLVEHAIARGDLPGHTDAGFVTDLLLAPLLHRAFILGQPVPDDLVERTVDLVLAGARHQKQR